MNHIGDLFLNPILPLSHHIIGNLHSYNFINLSFFNSVFKTTISDYAHKYPHFKGLSILFKFNILFRIVNIKFEMRRLFFSQES